MRPRTPPPPPGGFFSSWALAGTRRASAPRAQGIIIISDGMSYEWGERRGVNDCLQKCLVFPPCTLFLRRLFIGGRAAKRRMKGGTLRAAPHAVLTVAAPPSACRGGWRSKGARAPVRPGEKNPPPMARAPCRPWRRPRKKATCSSKRPARLSLARRAGVVAVHPLVEAPRAGQKREETTAGAPNCCPRRGGRRGRRDDQGPTPRAGRDSAGHASRRIRGASTPTRRAFAPSVMWPTI